MYSIDSTIPLTLSCEEVLKLANVQITGKDKFKEFADGLRVESEFLLSDKWSSMDSAMTNSIAYSLNFVMLEILPHCFDIQHLNKIGGCLSMSINGVGDYTIYELNQRVVVLTGLPVDIQTNQNFCDIAIAPEVFISFLRGLLLNLSEDILESDDEDENRQISDAELQLYGMPAGGKNNHCSQDTSICGADKTTHVSCNTDAEVCGADINSHTHCTNDVNVCGANVDTHTSCNTDASACGANVAAGTSCAGNAGACGANASTAVACAGNATACGAAANAATACVGNAAACGADVDVLDACAAKATACGADISAGTCGANADACGAKVLDTCGAHAGACGVDIQDGDPVSACAVNVIPGLPSC